MDIVFPVFRDQLPSFIGQQTRHFFNKPLTSDSVLHTVTSTEGPPPLGPTLSAKFALIVILMLC